MSETNVGQAAFSFGSNPPAGGGWRPAGRSTAADLDAGGQGSGVGPVHALQGRARPSRRSKGASPAGAPQATARTGLPWLTAAEATGYLGFPTRKALYSAVERGQVPAHKLGRRLRFRLEELDALLGRAR
jgi:excisionase family DNA binding protein